VMPAQRPPERSDTSTRGGGPKTPQHGLYFGCCAFITKTAEETLKLTTGQN
jgi:hypothetical protein